MKKIPILMDCDPGHDDAIAIILALSSEKLDVLGITSVCGNKKRLRMSEASVNFWEEGIFLSRRGDQDRY